MYFKMSSDSDLSNTSYRCIKLVEEVVYIQYNEGFIGDDWVVVSEEEVRVIAPEWFEKTINFLTEAEEREIDILLNTEYIACLLESQLI